MAGFSDFLENELLDHVFSNAAYSPGATLYLALFTAAPTDAGGGTECSGGSYDRADVANNATNFPAASGGAKSNGASLPFATASGSWGLVTHWALFDANSGGNMLVWGALTADKTIDSGDTPSFAIGDLDITLD